MNRYFPEGTVDFHSVIYSSKDVLHPSSLSEKSFETKKREIADIDVSVNDSPTCKSHELYLKTAEERRRKEELCGLRSHRYIKQNKIESKDTRDNIKTPCTLLSESSISDKEEEHASGETTHVPINASNKMSFMKSDSSNGSHSITNENDLQSSNNPSNSSNEAVMQMNESKSDMHKEISEEEEKLYFSKRRIRRSTGYENQRYEVLPGHEDEESPMTVVVQNDKSLKNTSVIKAEKQTVTTYEIIDWEDVPESVRHHFRKKAADRLASSRNGGNSGIRFGNNRRLKKEGIDKKKTTCMLYLQADHLFHEQMGYSEEASIEMMTRHVQRVNSIYKPIGIYILLDTVIIIIFCKRVVYQLVL